MIQVIDIQIDLIGSGPIWFKILGKGIEWWPKSQRPENMTEFTIEENISYMEQQVETMKKLISDLKKSQN